MHRVFQATNLSLMNRAPQAASLSEQNNLRVPLPLEASDTAALTAEVNNFIMVVQRPKNYTKVIYLCFWEMITVVYK